MDTLKAIVTRRSIRKFRQKSVAPEALRTIIEAGMYAPSARNEQPWHFIVISERGILDEIMHAHPYASMLAQAPVAILVCGDTNLEKSPGYWSIDCAAATQNMLLAAHDMGIGSVWLGVHPRQGRKDALGKICGLPHHVEPFSLVALGYPDETKEKPDRWREERIHTDRWNEPSGRIV